MNIFYLHENPVIAAQLQCDKHVCKMPTESAQMLSSVHRMVDGEIYRAPSKSGRTMIRKWSHPSHDDVLYGAVHTNHPCTVWTRETIGNYLWHYEHFVALCKEYEYRYGREHLSYTKLNDILKKPPKNIPLGEMTKIPLAMKTNPECINESDPVGSYRSFYQTKQRRFKMNWTKRSIPEWFKIQPME